MGFCFKQFRVALQREPSFEVSEEIQELKLSFLSRFSVRLRDDARLLKICLSDGSRVRYQRVLARRFFVINSRT